MMFSSRLGRAIRSLRIFLPKSLRTKLSWAVRKTEWLFAEQKGLQSDIDNFDRRVSDVVARLSDQEAVLPEHATELRKLGVRQDNLETRLNTHLTELAAAITAQTAELRMIADVSQSLQVEFAATATSLSARQDDLSSRLSAQLAELATVLAAQTADVRMVAQAGQRLESSLATTTSNLSARQDDLSSRFTAQLAEIAGVLAAQTVDMRMVAEAGQRLERDLAATRTSLSARQDDLSSRLAGQLAELATAAAAQTAELRSCLPAHAAEFGAELESRLASRDSELRAIRSELQIVDAHLAFVMQPSDLSAARHLQAKLNECGKELPDDIQERILRLELQREPYDLKLTRSLIAVRYGKLGRPPLPETPAAMVRDAAGSDAGRIDELLNSAAEHARAGDTFSLYAVLWQAVIRDPYDARGWAEYARHLAYRGDWSNCRIAADHALKAPRASDSAAVSLLSALSMLADEGQLKDLEWKAWMQQRKVSLQKRPQMLNLVLYMDDIEAAKRLLPQVTKKWPKEPAAWLIASRVAYEQECFSKSYSYLRRALQLDFPLSLHDIVRTGSAAVSQILHKLDKGDEIADWISQASAGFPEINLVPARPSTEALIASRRMRSEALDRGLPSALLITQAKSASVSIGNIFSSGFSLPTVLYSFLDVRAVAPWLEDFLLGGSCYTTHLIPSPQNIDLLARGGARNVIVNVRDPRQVMISMIEHVRKYPRQLPPSIRGKVNEDGNQAVEWAIEHFLPEAIGWIEGWVKARDKVTVNFTTFEEFVADKDKFLDKIIAFYGGDPRYLRRESVFTEHAGIDYHHRRGTVDEWRSRVTPRQSTRINTAVPNYFWDLFGWQP
jgi:hypothetical protein